MPMNESRTANTQLAASKQGACLWLSKTIMSGLHTRALVLTNRGAYDAICTTSEFASNPVMKAASATAACAETGLTSSATP